LQELSQEKGDMFPKRVVYGLVVGPMWFEWNADDSKIKCNRRKPSCEACQLFNCACIYGKT